MSQPAAIDVNRIGAGILRATNAAGAELTVAADGRPDAFSPAELLQVAIAGCALLSAEQQVVHRLGPDVTLSGHVEATHDEEMNRLTTAALSLLIDDSPTLASLDAEARERFLAQTARVIDRLCMVKRSVREGMDIEVRFPGLGEDSEA